MIFNHDAGDPMVEYSMAGPESTDLISSENIFSIKTTNENSIVEAVILTVAPSGGPPPRDAPGAVA